MKQISVNLYTQKFEKGKVKTCSTGSQNEESIFSQNNKIFGSGLIGTTLMNMVLPSSKTGILSKIKGLNVFFMGFCLLGLAADIFRKANDNDISNVDKTSDKSGLDFPKSKSQFQNGIKEAPRIAVIDDFSTEDDNCGKLKHGDIVTNIIKSQLPDAKIEKRNICNFSEALEEIIDNVKRGVHYDAINLSCSYNFSVKLEDLKIFDENNKRVKITQYNIDKYKMQIKKYMENKAKEENYYEKAKEFLRKIEYLTDRKIPVFLGNSNNLNTEIRLSDTWDFNSKYANNNNPYLITVSTNNSHKDYYASFSDMHEKGILELTKTDNGIDYTGNGIADITNPYYLKNLQTSEYFEGNSFAVPHALVEHLKAN